MGILEDVGKGDGVQEQTPSTPSETFVLSDKEPSKDKRTPQENAVQEPALVAFVKDRYMRAKNARLTNENIWMESYRNFRGTAAADPALLASEKSRVFIKLTKTKTLAAYGQIMEIVFPNDGSYPIKVEATTVPENIAEDISIETSPENAKVKDELFGTGEGQVPSPYGSPGDGRDLEPGDTQGSLMKRAMQFVKSLGKSEKVSEGPAVSPTEVGMKPAEIAADKMSKKIQDQLEEGEIDKELRLTLIEQDIFGTGCLKGPLVRYIDLPYWDEEGKYLPTRKRVPDVRYKSIWNIYPDPDAINSRSIAYIVERHRINRGELRAMKDLPHFRTEAVEAAIEKGFNYTPEWWEANLRDSNVITTQRELFEVLEYWGTVDIDIARTYGLKIPDDLAERKEIPVCLIICGSEILKLVINPFQPYRLPYHLVPYEVQLYSVWGVGVPENMRDEQRIMNGMWRLAIDNAVLSGNVIFECDQTKLQPGQDTKLTPGKIFFTNSNGTGKAFEAHQIPNVTAELTSLMDKARSLVDESTGISSYSHGDTGVNPSVGRTSSGISMLMSAAATSIKTVVKNIDDYLLTPLGQSLFYFNMQFDFDPKIKGDLKVRAMGTQTFMKNEIRSQRITTALQLCNNPQLLPWIKIPFLLKTLFDSMDINPADATNTSPEALRFSMHLAEIAKNMQPQQQPGQAAPPGTQEQQGVAMPGEQGFSAAGSTSPTKAPDGQGVS